MKPSRVFWFAPINSSKYASLVEGATFLGAASRKVINLALALRGRGVHTFVVAMPVVGRRVVKYISSAKIYRDQVPVIKPPSTHLTAINRLLAAFYYFYIAVFKVRRSGVVVLYNFHLEYFFACFYLFIVGNRAFLELEDFPVKDGTLRGVYNSLSYCLVRPLCNSSVIAVSDEVASISSACKALVIQGIISREDAYAEDNILKPSVQQGVVIHYGGSIVPDTGLDIFVDAVRLIREQWSDKCIVFEVTGFGNISRILDLANVNSSYNAIVNFHSNLAPSGYLQVLRGAHASLSLKNPSSVYGYTTFPSKVIEIAANGILLISSNIPSVCKIFGDAALFMNTYSASELASKIIWVHDNLKEANELAVLSKVKCLDKFSMGGVGIQLENFLLAHKK